MATDKEILIRKILSKQLMMLDDLDGKTLIKIERSLYKEKPRLLGKILIPFKFILRISRFLIMEILRQIILISIGLVFIFPLTNLTILRHNKIYDGINKLVNFNSWKISKMKR